LPSRFIDELPEAHVDVVEAPASFSYGGYGGGSRFDRMGAFGGSSYHTPGWQRAQSHQARTDNGGYPGRAGARRTGPMLIEGELVAKSVGGSGFAVGGRVFHTKFGPGTVAAIDGNKLTVDFDKAGRKMVLDSFVDAVG
jgi:DNA helicase-2/ATP-dependent DNA helicase PcrA